MKLNKFLMFAAAAMTFAACSNDEDANGIQGEATVTVNIKDVMTKALEDATTTESKPVEINSLSLTLDAVAGGKTLTLSDKETDGTYKFENVRSPKSLTVSINGGQASGLELKDVVNTGLAEPLHDVTTEFTRTDETHYTATLQPAHRLARLQFSEIKHAADETTCIFETATLDGLFLNNVVLTEGETATKDLVLSETLTVDKVWETVSTDWATDAPVFDAINGADFLTNQTGWPAEEGKCYAYNILPCGENQTVATMPKLTLCFSGVTVKDDITPIPTAYRFAKVAKYMTTANKEIKAFEAGKIYNITGLTVADTDMGETPEGGKDIILTATVEVTPWTLVQGKVDWE